MNRKKVVLHKDLLAQNKEAMKEREERLRPLKEDKNRIAKAERLKKEYDTKVSHNWYKTYHKSGISSIQPMLSHCKDCGINYYIFKRQLTYCPKNLPKEEKKDEES